MKQTSIHVSEFQDRYTKAMIDASRSTGDIPSFDSRSEVYRILLDHAIDSIHSGEEVEVGDELVDSETLLSVLPTKVVLDRQREQHKEEAHPIIKGSKVAERFGALADDLYSGRHGEKAPPSVLERVSESYLAELEDHVKMDTLPEESVETQRAAIRSRVESYREEYESAGHAPSETMREVPEEAKIGAEVGRLKAHRGAFVEDLRELASTDRFTNPEDLMKALGYDYGVSVETVSYLLDEITPSGTDGRQALKSGSGVEVPELVEEPEIEEPESEVEDLPEDAIVRTRTASGRGAIDARTDD